MRPEEHEVITNCILAFALAIALLLVSIACTGCELVAYKQAPSPEIVVIKPPEVAADVSALKKVEPGEQIFTTTSEVPANDGKHLLGSQQGYVDLYYAPEPTPEPTYSSAFGANGYEFR